jgi:hypothetical protein
MSITCSNVSVESTASNDASLNGRWPSGDHANAQLRWLDAASADSAGRARPLREPQGLAAPPAPEVEDVELRDACARPELGQIRAHRRVAFTVS